jgi:hypothetical protein
MKTKYFITVFFILLFSFSSIAQYNVDINEAPSTPIPIKYTLEHFNLKGAVKEFDDTISVYTFNEDGKLISEKSIYGTDNKYIYDNNGELMRIEPLGVGIIRNIIRDGGNRVIESSSNRVGDKFMYDSKGNYFEKYNIYDKMVTERHFYDPAGRILKSEFFFPIINTSSVKTYSYKKDGDFIRVNTEYVSSNKEKPPTINSLYYKNGNYYGNSKNDNLKYDSYGNPLSYLDENGNISSQIKYTYFWALLNNDSTNTDIIKPQNPSTNTTSCVSGDCKNGWGKYDYDNGYYEGFWTNGKRNGYGIYNWNESGKYIGNWKDDTMNGYGAYIAENNDNTVGNFSNSQLDGLGLTVIGDKWTYGEFSKGNLVVNYTLYSNNVDTGCVAGDCQNKYGGWKWSNGDNYSGFFKNGKLKMGTYNFKNGDQYTGTFNNDNQFHGSGRYFYKDGGYYGGEWVNGTMQGRGYYHNSSFEQQIGEWSNGSLVKSLKK